jgi:hypothetical protein
MDFIMTGSSTGKNLSKTSPSRLGTYLATAVGSCGLATSADGAIVNIDLTNVQGNNITGPNGGVTAGSKLTIANWLGAGTGQIEIYNSSSGYTGLDGYPTGGISLLFAVTGSGYASPRNFAANATIDSSATWTGVASRIFFDYAGLYSANFGANSFMGFRFGSSSWNYGWIEATWNSSTTTFQLLSAAYESTPDTAILAGAAAPVPEPSTGALAALVLGGTALGVARRRRKQEAAATTEQAV